MFGEHAGLMALYGARAAIAGMKDGNQQEKERTWKNYGEEAERPGREESSTANNC
jgi:hypothetical protein